MAKSAIALRGNDFAARTVDRAYGFHLAMAVVSAAIIAASAIGFRLTSLSANGVRHLLFSTPAILIPMMIAPAYCQWAGRPALRDASLMIPWAALLSGILSYPVYVAARLRLPIRDAALAGIDTALGVSVPSMVTWATRHHWLGTTLNLSYGLLVPMLLAAVLLPAMAGKLHASQTFLAANLIAFAVAVPIFALVPAIGPWSYYHLAATLEQEQCQALLLGLRSLGPYTVDGQGAGIVCFPSFHVVWAILSAQALSAIRPLRIASMVLAGMVVVSTMTTGWHYFSDVLGGVALAAFSIWAAEELLSRQANVANKPEPSHL